VDRAEVAIEAASPTVLNQRDRCVALSVEDAAIGQRLIGERRVLALLVERSQASAARVSHDRGPYALGVAKNNGIGERAALVGEECRVIAAHDNRNPAPAIRSRELERAPGGVGFHGHRDEVGRVVERDRFNALVVGDDFDVRRGEALEMAKASGCMASLVRRPCMLGRTSVIFISVALCDRERKSRTMPPRR
jgi:hypothetical protein